MNLKSYRILTYLFLLPLSSLAHAGISADDLCRKKLPQLKSQLSKNPDNPQGWMELRTCANELKEWNDAVDAAMAAKQKAPDNPEPRLILGMAQMQSKDYNRAIEYFDKTIELNSNESYAYFQMGMAYLFLNLPTKALIAAERAVEIDPKNAAYQRQASYTYMMLDDLPNADRAAHAALEIDPDDIAAHKILAHVYAKEGKADEAAQEAQAARVATAKKIAALPATPAVKPLLAPKVAAEKEKEAKNEKEDDADIIAGLLNSWEEMKTDLIAGRIDAALPYFSTYLDTRDQYRQAFTRMGPRAKRTFQNFGEPYDCEVVFLSATCKALVRNDYGTMHETSIRFERNPDRVWRIRSF
jgi:tetratricopeptide (TPR) repeat protein